MLTTLLITLLSISVLAMVVNLTIGLKIIRRPHLHTIFNVSAALQFLLIGITVPFTSMEYYQVGLLCLLLAWSTIR